MDLELSEEQTELRDEFRRQLTGSCGPDTLRAAIGQPGAIDRKLWRRLADTGVFGVQVGGGQGGLGAGVAEAVVVHEEIGRAAVPGPVVATALLASAIPEALDGSDVITGVYAGASVGMVEHLDGCDEVAVFSPTRIDVLDRSEVLSGISPGTLTPLDPLTPVHHWPDGDWPAGRPVATGPDAARMWGEGTLLSAATSVGLAAAAITMATAYAQEREQFGRPIGTFQAIKHLLADSLAVSEVARAAVHSAAVTFDEEGSEEDAWMAVACARLLASRAAQTATRACIQVHGGMGYTWELDAHLLLKRALVLDTHFETPDRCRERIAELL
jgi:alkylation response protein AidB-like acyl-CoA dehydrogenase